MLTFNKGDVLAVKVSARVIAVGEFEDYINDDGVLFIKFVEGSMIKMKSYTRKKVPQGLCFLSKPLRADSPSVRPATPLERYMYLEQAYSV